MTQSIIPQTNTEQTSVTASIVPDELRPDFLYRYFSQHCLLVENTIYTCANRYCEEYQGGYWQFYTLSNDGCYIAPVSDKAFILSNPDNYFEGTVSADAMGIIMCLLAYSRVAILTDSQEISEQFYRLRDYVLVHPEANQIIQAID